MLSGKLGVCHPTANEIRADLNLSSGTIVFDAISALERNGFILRQRRTIKELNSRRNVYQRPACEYTVLRLLQLGKLDAELHPTPAHAQRSARSDELVAEWLRAILGARFAAYEAASRSDKMKILTDVLAAALPESQ